MSTETTQTTQVEYVVQKRRRSEEVFVPMDTWTTVEEARADIADWPVTSVVLGQASDFRVVKRVTVITEEVVA